MGSIYNFMYLTIRSIIIIIIIIIIMEPEIEGQLV
jgi:hypothetical protein